MKLKLLFASALSLGIMSAANATKVTISVANFSFTPNNVTLQLGDTVVFKWIEGDHTTTSGVIPGGAAAWDSPMTSAVQTFEYKPTVVGVYNYVCTPHAAMGQVGKFTVTAASDISEYELAKSVFNLYPNPAQSTLHVAFANNTGKVSSIIVSDITGKTLLEQPSVKSEKVSVDINALANGTYFVRVVQDGKTYVRKFTISR